MVDTFFKEDYLLRSIESKSRVMEVKKMTRTIKDSQTGGDKIADRQMIIVSFSGNNMPREIRINGLNFLVEPHSHPVIQCRSCWRFGHSERLCRGKTRCKTCGKAHDEDNIIEGNIQCAHCGSTTHNSYRGIALHS